MSGHLGWTARPQPHSKQVLHEQQTVARGQIGINMVYRICVLHSLHYMVYVLQLSIGRLPDFELQKYCNLPHRHHSARVSCTVATPTAIGELLQLHAHMSFPIQRPTDNIRMNRDLGGGSLYDGGSYPIKSLATSQLDLVGETLDMAHISVRLP